MQGQCPRIHAGNPGHALRPQPGLEMLGRAPTFRFGDVLAYHQPACRDRRRFQILGVGADIAYMREGEGNNLPGKRRVGQGFLIPGHAGAETHFSHRTGGMRAETSPPENLAVGQHQRRGGAIGSPVADTRVRARRRSGQLLQRQPCCSDQRRPVPSRDGSGLPPLSQRFRPDPKQASDRLRPAQTRNQCLHGHWHGTP